MTSVHRTVLLNEAIEGLNIRGNNPIVLDGTFGGGGHSEVLCKKYPGIKLIAIDRDEEALSRGREKFKSFDCDIAFANANFRDLDEVLRGQGVDELDGMILDLGLSSDQLNNSGRGFSFMKDERLLMTMKGNPHPEDLTAEEIANTWSEDSLTKIIRGYGEERFALRIARGIVEAREKKPIKTTADLVKVIESSVPAIYRRGRIHSATRTFQALRIAVNDELGSLSEALNKGFQALRVGGRMSVISFHSLEDRIVKRFFSAKGGSASGGKENRVANIITKKPITPSFAEIKENPRSRSAKLRILEKTKNKDNKI